VGCLVLSNFGRKEDLLHYYPALKNMVTEVKVSEKDMETDGSIMIVLATDAPVNERQLHRIAKRCGIGLGRTGSNMANGSGDIVIANPMPHRLAIRCNCLSFTGASVASTII